MLLVLLMVGNVIQDRSEGARDREELMEIRAIAETIESQQDINTRLLELVEASGDRIEDCTTAGGECFREAQARTAEAVSGINEGTLRIVVAAQTCADRGLSGRLLTRCTIGLLGQ